MHASIAAAAAAGRPRALARREQPERPRHPLLRKVRLPQGRHQVLPARQHRGTRLRAWSARSHAPVTKPTGRRGMEPRRRGVVASMKIEIWSDVACPWCYIGKRRFETALAAFPHRESVEVQWRSYQLDPSLPGALRRHRTGLPEHPQGHGPGPGRRNVRARGGAGQGRGPQLPLRRRRGGQQLHRPPADPPRRRARAAGRRQGTPAQRPLRARPGHRQPGVPDRPWAWTSGSAPPNWTNCSPPTSTPTTSGWTSRRAAPWASAASRSS